ncbi:retrotransposon-derived protein PEG10 isoform 1 [Sugiyamaella lignohabitans]|uniref:Retrotransposon-derived protein PEG10 isoform 1 n=1 Tax=Sugiyamaella lignohabitans TaxID=796027 RepID=A0A161HG60_9ASCO|nr:retrotransposon-derived protein PEG10 isoform 1 [Sugiyamaella lignohabitans]XP_018734168.1 retrotransposon-derived protein PEG10 isoform 1 [Sugiyamaella lignohabitans]ANB11677.1 retrotransposon-derived protein PEG10 isoform 1 [Sugiyamaella lignohabitans]ANB11691.1 retrotransposon-derived protein PEG10 isoform 1 [Sugiyamaella lignohabitans]
MQILLRSVPEATAQLWLQQPPDSLARLTPEGFFTFLTNLYHISPRHVLKARESELRNLRCSSLSQVPTYNTTHRALSSELGWNESQRIDGYLAGFTQPDLVRHTDDVDPEYDYDQLQRHFQAFALRLYDKRRTDTSSNANNNGSRSSASRSASRKLSSEERRRREKEKLCLYCASPDHAVAQCSVKPVSNSSSSQSSSFPKPSSKSSGSTSRSKVVTPSSRVHMITVKTEPVESASSDFPDSFHEQALSDHDLSDLNEDDFVDSPSSGSSSSATSNSSTLQSNAFYLSHLMFAEVPACVPHEFLEVSFGPITGSETSVQAHVDTGAQSSLIDYDFAARHNLGVISADLDLYAYNATAPFARTHFQVPLSINWQGKFYRVKFVVVPNCPYPMVLGAGFLKFPFEFNLFQPHPLQPLPPRAVTPTCGPFMPQAPVPSQPASFASCRSSYKPPHNQHKRSYKYKHRRSPHNSTPTSRIYLVTTVENVDPPSFIPSRILKVFDTVPTSLPPHRSELI